MSRRYQHQKTDINQAEIVKALREIPGVMVETGHDDILVGYKGKTYWYEIKPPHKVNKDGRPVKDKRKTYAKQTALLDHWPGHYRIVWALNQIIEELELY